MIRFSRTDQGELKLEMTCSHEIVDDCFMFNRCNAASEGKILIMEQIGFAYEEYVKGFAQNKEELEYLNKEFEKVNFKRIFVTTEH